MSNNIIQLPGNSSYINNEESIACCYPTMTGNVETESLSAQTSSSPTILPAPSGNYSAAITVTLADAGNTSGVGPQGNTRVFYTTDGSTPSTSSKLYTAPFAVQPGTTVKAIGMWGAANQPTSYAAGYGFVPSSVVAAVYPGSNGAKTTVALVSISVSGTSNTIAIGGTLQVSATGTYSDGSSAPIVSSTVTWSTNNTAILSVSSSGLVTGVSSGSGNVTAKVGSISSSPYAVTVAPATSTSGPTLVSAYLNSTADTLVVGGTLQFTMIGVYSDGSSGAVPNSSIQWQTSNSSVLTVSSSGLATAVSAGPAMVAASMGSTSSSPWIVTVSATAPEVPTPAAPAAPVQDAFQGPFWKSGTPAGGSTSISNAHLFLNVPGGANHDAIVPSNQAVRMMQTIGNYNFDVSMKIDSDIEASNANTSQGMMVYSDAQDYLTYAVTTDGTNIHLVVYVVSAGVANKVFDDTNFSQYQNPIYLRLTRTGSAYVAFYSIDGSDWNQAASFTSAKAPASIGPFAGNYNSTPANAVPVVMSVNWFNVE
jgi:regulation of enolase protein 1 (concanavalin A-like superfamily)